MQNQRTTTDERGPERAVWRDRRAIALLLAAMLTTMANSTISPALPGLRRLFSDDPHAELLTRMLVSAPSLTVVLCAPLIGVITDHLDRRRTLLLGMAIFVITGMAGLILPDLPSIFASRLGLGLAVAMIMTTQTALVGDFFAGPRRQAMTGLQISARNFGGLVFITLAGWLAAYAPRLPFAVYGLAAFFLPLVWRWIPPTNRAEPANARADPTWTASPAKVHTPRWPLLVAALALLQMTTNMIFFLMPTQLPFYLEASGYDSARATGLALGCLMISGGFAALTYPRVVGRLGYGGTYGLGYLIFAAGLFSLAMAHEPLVIGAAVAAVGVGYSLVMPNFVALALDIAPQRKAGFAGGFLTASVFLGQFLSPLISTPAIVRFGYGPTYTAVALLLIAMAAAALSAPLFRAARKGQRA